MTEFFWPSPEAFDDLTVEDAEEGFTLIAPDDTAESLGLEDCDLIDLVALQDGRETAGKPRTATALSLPATQGSYWVGELYRASTGSGR